MFFIFNRPATTARVFEAIRTAKPRRLFVFADGPRSDRPDDDERCAAARALTERVDWPCDVSREYADANRGTLGSVSHGLDTVFRTVDRAIVLEDDCLPDPSFFAFCDTLLERYADDDRVMTIGGSRPARLPQPARSYAFSRYPLIWGWATWRRAWVHYDAEMNGWPEARAANVLASVLQSERARQYWVFILDRNWRDARHRNWDYSWVFASWRRDGLSIVPSRNLVSNIGFGADATHCSDPSSPESARPLDAMPFPLRHPDSVTRDSEQDDAIERYLFSGNLSRAIAEAGRRVRAHTP